MHSRFFTGALLALAMVFGTVRSNAGVTLASNGDEPCTCTPRIDFNTNVGAHDWFVTADDSSLTTTLIVPGGGPFEGDQVAGIIRNSSGAVIQVIVATLPPGGGPGDARATTTIPTVPGATYQVEVFRPSPHPSPNHASTYWLTFEGASGLSINSGFSRIQGGRTTWTLNVDAGDALGMRLHRQGLPSGGAMPGDTFTVSYQWVAPNGDVEPVESFVVTEPSPPAFIDTMIPPPTGLTPGAWRLRLQTLDITGITGFDYRLEKTTGADTRLHLEPGLAGRGLGRINFVDENGNPFLGTVNFTAGFGEAGFGQQVTFPVTSGFFQTQSNGTDVFPIPVSFTPPAGLIATPSSLAFQVPCDDLGVYTVVIAPPPPPPTLSVSLSPNALWPPNHKMATIEATISASAGATVSLVGITSNEPAAGDITGADAGTDDRSFELRATRLGGGSGRTYTVTYQATSAGGTTTASATVVVPHDQRK